MQVIHQLWKGRRVRVAGVLDQVAVDCPDDLAGVYQKYWELVYRRCYATLQDHEAACDAAQDVFVQALHSFEDIQNDVVRGLVDLARTISYERKRRPSREVVLAEPPRNGHSHDDPAEIAESLRLLASVWSGLSAVERRYLADKFAGFSFEEIAQRNRRALGTVSSNLARAREHARRMREPMLPGVLGLAAWRRLTDASRRARTLASETSLAAATQPVGAFTVSLTVAGLIAGAVPAASAGMGMATATRSHLTLAAASLPGVDAGAAMAGSLVGQQIHVSAQSAAPGSAPSHAGGGLLRLPGSGNASAETPEDVQISTATASPSYSRDHTIIALGYGATCGCNVLLRSTDGGATWQSAPGPVHGDQVVLPPAYPDDPAIYVGYSSTTTSGFSNYWTPRFGTAFTQLSHLPPGAITLPAGFDAGDRRIIAVTATGVWAAAPSGSNAAQPLLLDASGAAPSAVTAWGAPAVGVMVLTSSQAVGAGNSALAVSTSSDDVLWACPPAQSCAQVTRISLPPGAHLVASPAFAADRTVVAYQLGALDVSVDAGRSFGAIGLPWTGASVNGLALTPSSSGPAVWAVMARGTGWALMTKPSPSAPWLEADGGNSAITSSGGQLVVIDAQRLLFLPAQGGLLCSVNRGVTWEARCPSA